MKVKNLGFTCLVVLSTFVPSSFLTAQQTTTLQAITDAQRAKKVKKQEQTRDLANPKQENMVATKSTTGNKTKQQEVLTETDIASIQKRIDKQKADLATAKTSKTWSEETIEEKETEIATAEKDLQWQKKKLTLPVGKSN